LASAGKRREMMSPSVVSPADWHSLNVVTSPWVATMNGRPESATLVGFDGGAAGGPPRHAANTASSGVMNKTLVLLANGFIRAPAAIIARLRRACQAYARRVRK
jgi:hypothetical protein